MEVAVVVALLFFCILLLASCAIAFLLIRHCLAALRRRRRHQHAADADAEAARAPAPPPAPRHRHLPHPSSAAANKHQQQQEVLLLSSSIKQAAAEKEEEEAAPPRRLTWREVEALTGGFDEAAVVGRGGSSTVYLAGLGLGGDGKTTTPVAVKVHRWCSGGERRLRAFRQELDLLRRLRHPNIVKILAYSDDHEEEGALVLEYLAGGTLADALHGGGASTLPWAQRMRVLHDVACALEHLHGGAASTAAAVVHGDVSASNVLLHLDNGGARLCDLGSACEGFSASVAPSRAAVGSPGYADPFFLRTGIASTKSDVYGFGVLLLEAVTGLPPAAAGDNNNSLNLTARILPRVRGGGAAAAAGIVDARLAGAGDGGYDEEEADGVVGLAVECVAAQPGLRPTMAQVRAAIAEKAARSIAKAGYYGHRIQLSKLMELT